MPSYTPTLKPLDLLLVNPSMDFTRDKKKIESLKVEESIPRQLSPHIGVGYLLAAAKRSGIRSQFVDMVSYEYSLQDLLDHIRATHPSLVGFTAFTTQIKAAGVVAKAIRHKFPHIKICAGGPHVTAAPKETLDEFPDFDFVIRGEADDVIVSVMRGLNKSTISGIKGVITRGTHDCSYGRVRELDKLPFPAWEEFCLVKYPGADPHRTQCELPVSTSRGCHANCIFCVRPFGRERINRHVECVISEVERDIQDFGAEAIYFLDETFVGDIAWNEELFRQMINRGLHRKIRWSCETRVDKASPELFKAMRKAGCYYVFFGFESADDEMLKRCGKGFKAEQIKTAITYAKKAGLVCAGSFILGLPGETEETALKSMKLAKELGIYSTTFPIAVPFPGTTIRRMAEKHQFGLKILTNDWDNYGKQYPGVMDSDTLSIDRLRELQKQAYEMNPKKELGKHLKDAGF